MATTLLYLRPSSNYSIGINEQHPNSGAHWDKVDDAVGAPDDNTTYVYGYPGATETDKYNIPAHGISGNPTINFVRVTIRVRCASTKPGAYVVCRPKMTTHGVDYTKYPAEVYSTWANRSGRWNANPYTESAWTWTEITAMKIGVFFYISQPLLYKARCTQVYATVSYEAIEEVESQAFFM